jgi:hypothetical protein
MPFKQAHWWVLAVFPLAALAFWPSYVSVLGSSPASYHFHGLSASAWLLLLAIQSWSIAAGHRAFHRTNGLVSFVLFPLFMAGGATIFAGMADRFIAAETPFYRLYPPRLAWLDFIAIAGLAWFYFQALRYRRFVGRHSSYLLATVIFLLPPMLGRLAPLAMGLDPGQPDFFERMYPAFHFGNAASAAIAFFIAWRAGRNGRPFALAGLLVLLSTFLFEVPGGAAWWWDLYPRFAELPTLPLALVAAVVGTAVGWAGWTAGKRAQSPPAPLATA